MEEKIAEEKKARKLRVKLEFHFPAYDLDTALKVAERVETDGNGTLSEATLAMNMAVSVKSSGFQLKVLTTKQFGLLLKQQEDVLVTTDTAKAIFKPTSDSERQEAFAKAFYTIELFKAVGDKYEGTPLPPEEAFKNILEREFKIPRERVQDAYSKLMSSAKTAGILYESQGKTYLLKKGTGQKQVEEPKKAEEKLTEALPSPKQRAVWEIRIDSKDFAGMDGEAIKAALEGFTKLAEILRSSGISNKEEQDRKVIDLGPQK